MTKETTPSVPVPKSKGNLDNGCNGSPAATDSPKAKYDPIEQVKRHSRVRKLSETASNVLGRSFDEDLDEKKNRHQEEEEKADGEHEGRAGSAKQPSKLMWELHFSGNVQHKPPNEELF